MQSWVGAKWTHRSLPGKIIPAISIDPMAWDDPVIWRRPTRSHAVHWKQRLQIDTRRFKGRTAWSYPAVNSGQCSACLVHDIPTLVENKAMGIDFHRGNCISGQYVEHCTWPDGSLICAWIYTQTWSKRIILSLLYGKSRHATVLRISKWRNFQPIIWAWFGSSFRRMPEMWHCKQQLIWYHIRFIKQNSWIDPNLIRFRVRSELQ